MFPFNIIVAFCWCIFVVYWYASAFNVKKTLKGQSLWKSTVIRVGILVVAIFLIRSTPIGPYLGQTIGPFLQHIKATNEANPSFVLGSIGAALTALGLGFAIWARIHLGRNWGMPMAIKEKPELVTTGPYKYVRHPIYTGAITALFGTAFVIGLVWLIPFAGLGIFFIYSLYREEKLLIKEFPNQYPAYKKRTKALIPFIY